jgi:hypothetical protein
MAIIKHPILYVGSRGEKHLYTLYDSGSNLSCILPDFVEGLAIPELLGRPRRLLRASEGGIIEVKYVVRLDFEQDLVFVDPKCAKIQLIYYNIVPA